jgi:hypothetical protein
MSIVRILNILILFISVACSNITYRNDSRTPASQHGCRNHLQYFIAKNKGSTLTIENKLNNLPINKDFRIIVEGDNDTLLVTLSDGTKGVFKPDISKSQKGSESEIVAYQISKLLGFDLVPPTVRRTFNGKSGSLQLFIENSVPANRTYFFESQDQDLRQRILDYILINGDRNEGNFLIGSRGEIYSIDHEKSFASFWEDSKTVAPDEVIMILVRPDMQSILDNILTIPVSVFEELAQNLPKESREMLIRRINLLKKEMAE